LAPSLQRQVEDERRLRLAETQRQVLRHIEDHPNSPAAAQMLMRDADEQLMPIEAHMSSFSYPCPSHSDADKTALRLEVAEAMLKHAAPEAAEASRLRKSLEEERRTVADLTDQLSAQTRLCNDLYAGFMEQTREFQAFAAAMRHAVMNTHADEATRRAVQAMSSTARDASVAQKMLQQDRADRTIVLQPNPPPAGLILQEQLPREERTSERQHPSQPDLGPALAAAQGEVEELRRRLHVEEAVMAGDRERLRQLHTEQREGIAHRESLRTELKTSQDREDYYRRHSEHQATGVAATGAELAAARQSMVGLGSDLDRTRSELADANQSLGAAKDWQEQARLLRSSTQRMRIELDKRTQMRESVEAAKVMTVGAIFSKFSMGRKTWQPRWVQVTSLHPPVLRWTDDLKRKTFKSNDRLLPLDQVLDVSWGHALMQSMRPAESTGGYLAVYTKERSYLFWSLDDEHLASFVIGLSNLAPAVQPVIPRQIKLQRAWAKLGARGKAQRMRTLLEALRREAATSSSRVTRAQGTAMEPANESSDGIEYF